MTRTMTLTLTSSLMMLAAACSSTDPGTVDRAAGDPVDAPVVDDPADPDPDATDPDPGSPPAGRPLSQDEKDALSTILGDVDVGGGLELGDLDELGTVTLTLVNAPVTPSPNSGPVSVTVMDGFALQTLQSFGNQSFDFTIVVAFDGLDAQAQTVDELVFVFAPLVDVGTVAVGDAQIDEAFAVYADEVSDLTYFGQSGDFTIDAITLDPTTETDPCKSLGEPYGCPTVEGTFEGTLQTSTLGFTGVVVISNDGLPSGTGTPLDIIADIDVPLARTTFSD